MREDGAPPNRDAVRAAAALSLAAAALLYVLHGIFVEAGPEIADLINPVSKQRELFREP